MKNKLSSLKIIFITLLLLYPTISFSEPFVVLEYRGHSAKEQIETDNVFLNDLNHSSKHIVLKNETLSDIMLNYYGTKSFNNNGIISPNLPPSSLIKRTNTYPW